MDEPKTLTVPEAGRVYFDLGRNASYQRVVGTFRRSGLVAYCGCQWLHWSECSKPRYPRAEQPCCLTS